MQNASALRDFASRCRRMAQAEHDRRLRSMFLTMADDYEKRAEQAPH
jgi:hypothetical protein